MKEFFRDVKFHKSSGIVIAQCETIIGEYAALNLRLTLRQLYYQLVSAL